MRQRAVLPAVLVVLALGASACAYLKPGAGAFQLEVRVGPPGAHADRVVEVSAPGLAPGTAATVEVRLDRPRHAPVATGAALPFAFTLPGDAAGPGAHVVFALARSGRDQRRGLGGFDNRPRLNQLQAVGTHNSYHLAPLDEPWSGIEAWQVSMSSPGVQLAEEGVRQFELDVNVANDGSGRLDVFHVPIVDARTTCLALVDCLGEIKTWSDAHPAHAPVAVLLELKDNDLGFPVPYGFWDPASLDALDALIRGVFDEDEMFTPDDLRGGYASLPEAIATDGWPTIDTVRGQVMFLMDNGGTLRSWYTEGRPALEGRVLFTNASPGAPDAAFVKRNDPIPEAAEISVLVAAGYVVRTRADADTVEARANDTTRRDAALESGAHWVSTDFAVPGRAFGSPYYVVAPGGTPSRCNPVNTALWCESRMIEALP